MSYGELIVDYTDADALKSSIPGLQQYLTEHYPDAYVRIKRYNLMYEGFPGRVDVLRTRSGCIEELVGSG